MGGLYFVAVATALVVSLWHLQALENKERRQSAVGALAMLLFLGLGVVDLILGPWWRPVAAVFIGAMAQAILEEYALKGTEHPGERVGAKIIVLAKHRRSYSRRDRNSSPPTAA